MGYGGRGVVVATCTIVLAGCSPPPAEETDDRAPVVQLGAPGEDNRTLTAAEASELTAPAVTAADVEFVRMMIPHHEQALEMTALVSARTERDDLPLLAERIEVSQTDEIERMQRWLAGQRHERASRAGPGDGQDPHAGHQAHLMAGMATPEEMSRLSAAEGEAFDELFLRLMVRHHEGAVTMVEELLASGEGGQNPEVFQLAQHIEADQRVEIARMKQLLADLASEPARRSRY